VKLGFHLSISKGFEHAFMEVKRLGCECVQIFVKNPRSWNKKSWSEEEIYLFNERFSKIPVFSHLSYLPNLAMGREKDLSGFFEEIELSLTLGIQSIVVHLGSNPDKKDGLEKASSAINRALEFYPINILLENSSGQGNSIGSNIDEISRIFERLKVIDRVKMCLDVAHLFQAGIDIRDKTIWEDFLSSTYEALGNEKIGLIHLNDSKTDLGSRIDRHWHIGLGKMGLNTFSHIINEPTFKDLCAIMETPEMGKMDHVNMMTARSLLLPLMPHSFS
jgi:deoxyribonuclease-4